MAVDWKEASLNGAVAVLGGKIISGIGFVSGISFLQTNIMGVTLAAVAGGIVAIAGLQMLMKK